jgi:hypothetical protein
MAKTTIVVVGAAGAIALAVVLGVFTRPTRTPAPPPRAESDPVATSATPDDSAAAERALAPLPPTSAPRAAQPKPADAGQKLDEASILAKLHELAHTAPLLSLQLAREAVARFPNSPNAPEFEWNVVKALANMEQFEEAREEARLMVERYPGSSFTDDVDRHLLHHPPNPP